MSPIFREIQDFIRFFWKTPTEEKAVVFYTEHEGYYPNFEGLIEELISEHKQMLCYITSDPHDPILRTLKPQIKTFYINKLLALFMPLVNCKVFVMTLTDLNQYHLKRSANSVHYVYVFHSMISTHLKYLAGAFDYYDSIFCVGPYHIREILKREELHELHQKNLVKAGYYLLEQICSEYQRYLAEKPTNGDKTTVLIAPSWGENNIIESCGENLVELLLGEGYEVIVKPHPETVRRFPQLVNVFATRFGNNPAFTLEKSVASYGSLLKSDVLICDSSGVALEYAFGTGRPVLFLDVPYMIRNENYKELDLEVLELSIRNEIGVVVSHEKLDELPKIIENLKADRMNYKKQIDKLREQNVFAFGNSSEIGAQYILDIIREKKLYTS